MPWCQTRKPERRVEQCDHKGQQRKNNPPVGLVTEATDGPEHVPLEQRQVELAWEETRTLSPQPGILAFAAFQFDPEAAKDIDELTREKTGMTFLKVQMNPDLLTEDLPFEAGAHKRVADKIVDDCGIESLKIIPTP